MLYKKLNERTQNRSKNTLEQIEDFNNSLIKKCMPKIRQENFRTILLQEKVDWISSEKSKY